MKDEKLKSCESQNSLKGKSTFENSKISDRKKSSKISIKSKETNDDKKKSKKIIIIQKSKRFEKNKNQEKKVIQNSKSKDQKIKKTINKNKISTTVLRTKISNPILSKNNEKSKKTPCQPMKKYTKIDKQILTMSSLSRIKEKDLNNLKLKNKNKQNNNISLYKGSFLTLQNSNKVSKVYNFRKNKKALEKTKEENTEELDNISQDISPKIITDTMYKKDSKPINKIYNNTNKFNNNIISLTKNKIKNKNFFYDNAKLNQTIPINYRNQTLNTSCTNKTNESINKKSLNISVDKNKHIYNRNFLRNNRLRNYLKTEITKESNREIKNGKIPKGGLNKCNYLKYTVSATNKIVHKKIDKHSTLNISMSSRPNNHKKNKSINRKETNKLKSILILRNTISRYKLYNKNLLLDEKPKKEGIKSPKLFKNSTLYNSAKNCLNKINNYKMIKLLGKGSYGEVKLAIDKITLKKYAIKMYPKKILESPKKKNNIENEITILKKLDNINIMKLYEVIKTDKYQYLIMEYIEGISLLDIIKKEKNHYLEEKRALKIFKQIIQAINYCQSKNICHRDIKLENILTIKNDIVKLIDFGFAVITDKETYQTLLCGSPSYMAPEIVKKEKYIAQYSDIWSLGVLLYSMLYGRFPFKGKTQKELFENIKNCEVEFPNYIKINEKIISLFKKIFVISPIQRPSLNEILNEINSIGE